MSSKTTKTQAHARLSASGMHRWAECPGSLILEEKVTPGPPSPYATEGQEAHDYAEKVLTGKIKVKEGELLPYEIGPYLTQCWADKATAHSHGVEVTITLDKWFPGKKMFGTADFISYNKDRKKLTVRDLKYGKGVYVPAKDNDQLYYYGLGAFAQYPKANALFLEISQPRISEGASIQVITAVDLLNWLDTRLKPAVQQVEDHPNKLSAGSWCRFCKARGACPELTRKALDVAKAEFAGADEPKLLTDIEVAECLNEADWIEAWIRGVRAEGHNRLDHGGTVPGWKLVAKRAIRKWKNETEVASWIRKNVDSATMDECMSHKLKSPAQIEKLCDLDPALWERVSTGTTLAPANDDRNAVETGPSADFDDLETE